MSTAPDIFYKRPVKATISSLPLVSSVGDRYILSSDKKIYERMYDGWSVDGTEHGSLVVVADSGTVADILICSNTYSLSDLDTPLMSDEWLVIASSAYMEGVVILMTNGSDSRILVIMSNRQSSQDVTGRIAVGLSVADDGDIWVCFPDGLIKYSSIVTTPISTEFSSALLQMSELIGVQACLGGVTVYTNTGNSGEFGVVTYKASGLWLDRTDDVINSVPFELSDGDVEITGICRTTDGVAVVFNNSSCIAFLGVDVDAGVEIIDTYVSDITGIYLSAYGLMITDYGDNAYSVINGHTLTVSQGLAGEIIPSNDGSLYIVSHSVNDPQIRIFIGGETRVWSGSDIILSSGSGFLQDMITTFVNGVESAIYAVFNDRVKTMERSTSWVSASDMRLSPLIEPSELSNITTDDTILTWAGKFKKLFNSLGNMAFKDGVIWSEDISGIPSAFPPSGHSHGTIYVVTLLASGWSNKQQSITIDGLSASNKIYISPSSTRSNYIAYAYAQISADESPNTLVFECTVAPTVNIIVNIEVV